MTLAVADRLALTDLVHLYAAAIDDRRFDDVVELFSETAELRLPEPPRSLDPVRTRRGRDGVRAAMAAVAGLARTEHAIVGEVYAPGADADYALGRITCVAHHFTVNGDEPTDLVWHMRYDDEYLRTRAGWQRALAGVNAGVVGLLLAALCHPVWTGTVHSPADVLLVLLALAALVPGRWPPWLVVLASGVGGGLLAALG